MWMIVWHDPEDGHEDNHEDGHENGYKDDQEDDHKDDRHLHLIFVYFQQGCRNAYQDMVKRIC